MPSHNQELFGSPRFHIRRGRGTPPQGRARVEKGKCVQLGHRNVGLLFRAAKCFSNSVNSMVFPLTTSSVETKKKKAHPRFREWSLYPPEYSLLNPEDRELVDGMIRSLAKKNQLIDIFFFLFGQ